jgi:hypothetical protein
MGSFCLPDIEERVATLSMKQDRLLCTAALRLNVPPAYDHYMEWGFFDGSVRFYSTDSRKVRVPSQLERQWITID